MLINKENIENKELTIDLNLVAILELKMTFEH